MFGCLLGGGVVSFESDHPAYLGEALPSSSFVAEVCSQVVAEIVLLQWFHMFALCPLPQLFLCLIAPLPITLHLRVCMPNHNQS